PASELERFVRSSPGGPTTSAAFVLLSRAPDAGAVLLDLLGGTPRGREGPLWVGAGNLLARLGTRGFAPILVAGLGPPVLEVTVVGSGGEALSPRGGRVSFCCRGELPEALPRIAVHVLTLSRSPGARLVAGGDSASVFARRHAVAARESLPG